MKKFGLRLASACLICCCMLTSTVFAATPQGEQLSSTEMVSQLLPAGQTEADSSHSAALRGIALAQSVISISNQGGGAIGVLAHSAFYQTIEWGMLSVYLDVMTDNGSWRCVDSYEFEFTPEDEEDGELTSMSVGFYITDQPAGHYYRLRGIHEIEFLDDDGELVWEGKATRTDGILITKNP